MRDRAYLEKEAERMAKPPCIMPDLAALLLLQFEVLLDIRDLVTPPPPEPRPQIPGKVRPELLKKTRHP